MRKFTIISKKGVTVLQEVEVAYVTAMEDPSVMWLGEGETKYKVLKPESLLEKRTDGSLVSPVWCWHSIYSCELTARAQAEADIKKEMDRHTRKYRTEFTEEDYLARCKEIQVAYL